MTDRRAVPELTVGDQDKARRVFGVPDYRPDPQT